MYKNYYGHLFETEILRDLPTPPRQQGETRSALYRRIGIVILNHLFFTLVENIMPYPVQLILEFISRLNETIAFVTIQLKMS
jgi:hypothetical protein